MRLQKILHVELIEKCCRSQDWRIDRRTCPGFFQVLVLLGGQMRVELAGDTFKCHRPTAVTLHPVVAHSFLFSHEAYGFIVTMAESVTDDLSRYGLPSELFAHLFLEPQVIDLHPFHASLQHLEMLLVCAHDEIRQAGHDPMLMLHGLVSSALLLLSRVLSAQAPIPSLTLSTTGDFALFNRFRQCLEAHYKESWPVARYAVQCRTSETVLSRVCQQLGKLSPFEMIQQRLASEAAYQLTHSPNSVADIAHTLGFEDPAYFSRFFKRHHQVSPRAFKQQKQSTKIKQQTPAQHLEDPSLGTPH